MIGRTKNLITLAALLVAFAGGWFMLSASRMPALITNIDAEQIGVTGPLDGMQFVGMIGMVGSPLDLEDTWEFANGTFVSSEYETQRNYPRAPYYSRQVGDRIEFIGETRCTDKDASIAWRGAVENGTIKGHFTWTISRWYWTVRKEFWFEGQLVDTNNQPVNG